MAIKKLFNEPKDGKVVYNGIDLRKFYNNENSATIKDKYIKIIQIGIFSTNKNQFFSIKVLEKMLEKGINVKLTLFGRVSESEVSGYYEKIRKYIDKKGLREYVTFLSGDGDVIANLKSNNYLIFPSLREGFGIVPVEAQAIGLKCFVSDTVPHDIDCGGCDFLSLNQGPDFWAQKIINDYKETKGIHHIYDCNKFSNKIICEQYMRLYEGLE